MNTTNNTIIEESAIPAIFQMCKRKIFMFENILGTRHARLRGITKNSEGYEIHLSSLSDIFTDEDGELMDGRSIIIDNKSYNMSYDNEWLIMKISRVSNE